MSETRIDEVWDHALGTVKKRLSPVAFNTWFKNTTPVAIHEGFFVVSTPNRFTKEWIESRHTGLIKAALHEATKSDLDVKIVVRKEDSTPSGDKHLGHDPSASSDMAISARKHISPFNPKYTFDAFVVGEGNRFAHAAALAVAENPSSAYNPLFIYGGAGLGKTHILHAIGHSCKLAHPDQKARYLTSEKFTTEFINSIRDDHALAFQKRYRSIDILIIDDIQFIIDKERTQEEFFHTFNTLYEAHKQIIISSDRPPKDMPTLEDRLRSRFEWGLIVDISPPDLETRIAILKKKAEIGGIDISDEVINFIATKIQVNIRELEGALTRLSAFASLTSSEIDLSLAKDILKKILPESRPKKISIRLIQTEVARYYGLTVADLCGSSRARFVSYPRQVGMYITRSMTSLSLPKIGEFFGGRDHTTVLHANSKIEKLISSDGEASNQVRELINRIKHKGS